jgi:hypothetical protein
MKVVTIGCSTSEIISACRVTISNLAKGGHKVYAIIAAGETSKSSSSLSSSYSSEVENDQKLLAQIGIAGTFLIDSFDYSAITQSNADAVRMHINNIYPSLIIMPFWKSPNHMRRILARTSLIACRGIGSVLMYELDAKNTSFNPTVIFKMSEEPGASLRHANFARYEKLEEKLESHRTLLLEEGGLI